MHTRTFWTAIHQSAGHRVGIAHADVGRRWDWLKSQCDDPDLERYLVNLLTASRDSIQIAQSKRDDKFESLTVIGIDHVFHGHTPVEQPLTVANRTWLDTQVDDDSPLTVLDVDAWINQVNRNR